MTVCNGNIWQCTVNCWAADKLSWNVSEDKHTSGDPHTNVAISPQLLRDGLFSLPGIEVLFCTALSGSQHGRDLQGKGKRTLSETCPLCILLLRKLRFVAGCQFRIWGLCCCTVEKEMLVLQSTKWKDVLFLTSLDNKGKRDLESLSPPIFNCVTLTGTQEFYSFIFLLIYLFTQEFYLFIFLKMSRLTHQQPAQTFGSRKKNSTVYSFHDVRTYQEGIFRNLTPKGPASIYLFNWFQRLTQGG